MGIHDERRNVEAEVADRIVEKYGFERMPNKTVAWFRLIVDSQHSAMVLFSKWDGPNGPTGGLTAAFKFGIARRDINELWSELFGNELGIWRTTVEERWPFFEHGRPGAGLSYSEYSVQEVEEWVDLWVPRLIESSTLPFVKEKLDEFSKRSRPTVDMTKTPRMMNKLLDGEWSDADEVEFLGSFHEMIEKFPADDERVVLRKAQLERLRAWLAEYPDGIERELTG